MVSHRTSSASGGQCPYGGICYPFPLSAQSHRPVLCTAGKIQYTSHLGPVLHVLGADMVDGTPLYDIKPYLPFTDSHPKASSGFAEERLSYALEVNFPKEHLEKVPVQYQKALTELLAQDPRPSYQRDAARIYGLSFAGMEVRFTVSGRVLTVCSISFSAPF